MPLINPTASNPFDPNALRLPIPTDKQPTIKPPTTGPGGFGGPAPTVPTPGTTLPGGLGGALYRVPLGPPQVETVMPGGGAPQPGSGQPNVIARQMPEIGVDFTPPPAPIMTLPKNDIPIVAKGLPETGVSYEPPPNDVPITRAPNPTPVTSTVLGPMQHASSPYQVSNTAGALDRDIKGYNPGSLTPQGMRYGESILSDLSNADNPYVRSIRETAERKATANSYGARQQAEESLGAAGVMPGTSQYSRALSRSMAGANDANRDLFNQAAGAQRDFYQKALDRAGDFEKMVYDRSNTERDYATNQAKYTDERSDKQNSVNEASRLENKGDILAAINSIQDPVARQAAMNNYIQGGDVRSQIGSMYSPEGKLKDAYKSESPGQIQNRALEDRVRQAFQGRTNPATGRPYTEAEIQSYIGKYAVASLENQYNPVFQGQEDNVVANMNQRLQRGEKPTADDVLRMPETSLSQIPFGASALAAFQASNKTGGWVKLPNGKVYKVVGQTSPVTEYGGTFTSDRHKDWVKLETQDGKNVWMDAEGNISETEPKDAKKGPYDGGLW